MATCLIIGTSNSIKEAGYRSLLASLRPDLTLRLEGVGASPSVLVPYVLSQVTVDDVDHVIIDTHVTDAAHVAYGTADADQCEAVLFECVDWLLGRGKAVSLLCMPQVDNADVARGFRDRRRRFAARRGVHFADGYEVLDGLREGYQLTPTQLFVNSPHAAWPITYALAGRLAAAIGAAPGAVAAGGGAARGDPAAPLPYMVARLDQFAAPGRRTERATSLMAKTYAVLAEGESITVELPEPATLIGLGFNKAGVSGLLQVTGDEGSAVKDLVTDGVEIPVASQDMVHMLTMVPTPVRGRTFRFTLSGERPPSDAARGTGAKGPDGGGQARAELETAVFRVGTDWRGNSPWQSIVSDASLDPPPRPLPPAEATIGRLAQIVGENEALRGVRKLVRTRIMRDPPFWVRPPQVIARQLADLAEAVDDPNSARKILRTALQTLSDTSGLRGRLARLRGTD